MTESSMSFSDDGFAGGLSDPLSEQYKHRRNVLDLLNKLHSYGSDNFLPLRWNDALTVGHPYISATVRSSSNRDRWFPVRWEKFLDRVNFRGGLVAILSDRAKAAYQRGFTKITLPRDKGTCTRCPIECRLLRTSSPWSCEVYLRVERQAAEIPFGPPITDKNEVEDRIRRAQLAVLNPSKDPLEFLHGGVGIGIKNETSFSSDVVSVRISGVIASVREGARESDIDEVKNLVRNVIGRPSCLILLVITCDTDLENQGARSLAREVDRSGHRTIHHIATREHSSWLSLLSNEQERCRHGWYCVKQPNQQQLEDRVSWQEARDNELNFFENTDPWNTLDHNLRSRLGTQSLTDGLGRILFNLIRTRLPDLLEEVDNKVQRLKAALAKLPQKPASDPVVTVMTMLESFQKDVALLVKGRPEAGRAGLIQSLHPDFRPFNKSDNPTETSEERGSIPEVDQAGQATEEDLEPTRTKSSNCTLYVAEVLKSAQDAITRELPNHCPYDIYVYFIQRFTEKWHIPAQKLFEDMKRQFTKELKSLVSQHFSEFSTGGLEHHVQRAILEQLERCSNKACTKMQECIALEREEPTTINDSYLADYKRKFHGRYTAERRLHEEKRPNLQAFLKGAFKGTDVMREAMDKLGQMGFDVLKKLAIEIMSEVRAYYQVAFKRFVDNVPMILDYEMLKGFERTLMATLYQELQVVGKDAQERSAVYLKEDPILVRRRESMEQDLKKFEAALYDLQEIPGVNSTRKYESDVDSGTELSN